MSDLLQMVSLGRTYSIYLILSMQRPSHKILSTDVRRKQSNAARFFSNERKRSKQVAYEWWKKIKHDMPYGAELQKVIADGEDVTDKVIEIEKAHSIE